MPKYVFCFHLLCNKNRLRGERTTSSLVLPSWIVFMSFFCVRCIRFSTLPFLNLCKCIWSLDVHTLCLYYLKALCKCEIERSLDKNRNRQTMTTTATCINMYNNHPFEKNIRFIFSATVFTYCWVHWFLLLPLFWLPLTVHTSHSVYVAWPFFCCCCYFTAYFLLSVDAATAAVVATSACHCIFPCTLFYLSVFRCDVFSTYKMIKK